MSIDGASTARDGTVDPDMLANRRCLSTADYNVVRKYTTTNTRGFLDFSLPRTGGFRRCDVSSARLNKTQFDLVRVDSVCGYQIHMKSHPDLVMLHFLIRGRAQLQQGSARTDAGPAQMVLMEAKAPSRKFWHGSTELLMVLVSRKMMERVLSRELGIHIGAPLSFGIMQVLDWERVGSLWRYVVSICRDLNDSRPGLVGHVANSAERTLLLLLLKEIPNNYSWAFGENVVSSAAPHYVRRVEEFIREHARDEIAIEDLIRVAGVSPRSVYSGFKRYRSMTPLAYLKSVRLGLAREVLIKAHKTGTSRVTQAAVAAGYSNLSQFSRDYKARYREAPSKTLAGDRS